MQQMNYKYMLFWSNRTSWVTNFTTSTSTDPNTNTKPSCFKVMNAVLSLIWHIKSHHCLVNPIFLYSVSWTQVYKNAFITIQINIVFSMSRRKRFCNLIAAVAFMTPIYDTLQMYKKTNSLIRSFYFCTLFYIVSYFCVF